MKETAAEAPPTYGHDAARPPPSHKQSKVDDLVIELQDLAKPKAGATISTGIGFLDHMLDQFNSHAQIGLSLQLTINEQDAAFDRNRNASCDQMELLATVGDAVGGKIRTLLLASNGSAVMERKSTFGCPLDEALVMCEILTTTDAGNLRCYTLAPYGSFPASGRVRIGHLQTTALERFCQALARAAHLELSLDKVRGTNAHHIVEASFKAFCRALRNLLDGVSCQGDNQSAAKLYGPQSANYAASVALQRTGMIQRQTKETSIEVKLCLNDNECRNESKRIDTGLKFLDAFLEEFAQHAGASLQLTCRGDLYIDEHHTAEDVAIALGQCIDQALGTKAGLNRMWYAVASVHGATVQCILDLSNRPCLTHNLQLVGDDNNGTNGDMVDDVPLEMMEHVLDSLVLNARMTCHLVQFDRAGGGLDPSTTVDYNKNEAPAAATARDVLLATAQSLGKAFYYCALVDTRRAGATASSKGTLSV